MILNYKEEFVMRLDEWIDLLEKDPKEAVLNALTVIILKNSDEIYNKSFYEIYKFLKETDKNDYTKKLLSIFEINIEQEVQLMNNLKDIEFNIITNLRNNKENLYSNNREKNKIVESKKMIKWWEMNNEAN